MLQDSVLGVSPYSLLSVCKSKCTSASTTLCWPNGLRVHLSSDLQAVEPLHIADSIGQDLSRSHGWHLSAGLGQVTVHPQPWLESHMEKNIYNVMSNHLNKSLLTLLNNNKINSYPETGYVHIKPLILNSLPQTWSNLRSKRLFYITKKWIITKKEIEIIETTAAFTV